MLPRSAPARYAGALLCLLLYWMSLCLPAQAQVTSNRAANINGASPLYHADNALYRGGATASWEMEFYVRFASVSGTQEPVTKTNTSVNGKKEWAVALVSSQLGFYTSSDGNTWANNNVTASTFGNLSANTWYRVVVYYSHSATPSSRKIGIIVNNAAAQEATATSGIFSGTAEFHLGTDEGGANPFTGRLAYLRRWNRLRTTLERDASYTAALTGRPLHYADLTTEKSAIDFAYDLQASPWSADAGTNGLTLSTTGTPPTDSQGPFYVPGPFRLFTFTGAGSTMATRHLLGGDDSVTYRDDLSYTYTPPAGTMLSDACLRYKADGTIIGAHSGYVSAPYTSNSLVIFKSTDGSTFSVVHQIDMTVTGRIPAVPGFAAGIGPDPVVSSPQLIRRPGGKYGCFFMYQPNGLLTSNSSILYIESLDSTLTTWGNATLVTGTGLPNPGPNGSSSGSFIDPSYLFWQGKHILIAKGFTSDNQSGNKIGLVILSSSTGITGPYNTVEADLRPVMYGGTTDVFGPNVEGADLVPLAGGGLRCFFDDLDRGGLWYCDSVSGNLTPGSWSAAVQVLAPSGITIRHASPANLSVPDPATDIAAGSLSLSVIAPTTATMVSTAATGGAAPYSYQWYRSTTSGPVGSAISGATSLTLNDSGLTPGTHYFYTLRAIDSDGLTSDSSQFNAATNFAVSRNRNVSRRPMSTPGRP